MSERNPMDELFRDKLYPHSMEPPMHLWDAIDAHNVAQAKMASRRRLIFYCATAIVSLALLFTLWRWTGQETRLPEPIKVQQEIQPIQPANPAQAEENTPTPLPEKKLPTEQNLAQVDGREKNRASQLIVAEQKRIDGARVKSNTTPGSRSIKEILESNATLHIVKNAAPLTQSDAASENATTVLPNNAANAIAERESSKSTPEANAEQWQDFAALNTRQAGLEFEPVLDLGEARPLYLPRTRGWRVYGELFGAMDQPLRSLEAREPEFEVYRQAREQTETVHAGYRASLRFSMISIDGVAVRSGLSYSNHRESFTYQQKTQYNSFQTVDIPVVIGYERNNVGKFTLSANAGVYVNMAFNQKGNFLSPDLNKVLDFSSKTPDAYPAFRNSLGVAWYGSLAASYPITPRLRLVLEPYVLHHTGSFTANDYAIDQRYQNWGIQVGLRKKINKYIYFAKP